MGFSYLGSIDISYENVMISSRDVFSVCWTFLFVFSVVERRSELRNDCWEGTNAIDDVASKDASARANRAMLSDQYEGDDKGCNSGFRIAMNLPRKEMQSAFVSSKLWTRKKSKLRRRFSNGTSTGRELC